MSKIISPAIEFSGLVSQMRAVVPEVFTPEGEFLNLLEGRWQEAGQPRAFVSPVDATVLGCLPMLDHATALRAVRFAKNEAAAWAATSPASWLPRCSCPCFRARPGSGNCIPTP